MTANIMVAEDDYDISDLLKMYLECEGYTVFCAENGLKALEIADQNDLQLALLDIMMPGMDGLALTQKIRSKSNIPIIILSARNMLNDKILGLNLGADDYLTKPFNPLEVVAKVKAILRRTYQLSHVSEDSSLLVVGELILDLNSFILKKDGMEITLTPTEFKILSLIMRSPGRVFTKEQIYEAVSGEFFENDANTLMVHISKLRSKIEDNPQSPAYIKTIRGLGYKIEKQKK